MATTMGEGLDSFLVLEPAAPAVDPDTPGLTIRLALQLLDASPGGIVAWDRDLRCIGWNLAMEQVFEVPRSRALGRSLTAVLPFLEDSGAMRHFAAALEGKSAICRRLLYAAPGSRREGYVDVHLSSLRDPRRRVVAGLAFMHEVTERLEAEELLRETEVRFRTMANCAPVLLWMSGADSNCTFFNESWLEFTGRTPEQESGFGWAEGIHHEDLQRAVDLYMSHFHRRDPFEMEYRLRRHDGVYRWILDRGVPRFTPAGDFAGYIGSCIDITDRRRVEQDLRELAGELLRSNQELERFAYVASHDLQEPIRSVINFSQLLEENHGASLDAEGRDLLAFTIQEGRRLKQLVDGLLEYSRTDRVSLDATSVDCDRLVGEVLRTLDASLTEAGTKITRDALPVVPGDEPQLYQVFQNLISNAIKFGAPRTSSIRIGVEEGDREWVFRVEDDGIGFDMRYADQIFEIFKRLNSRRLYPGSGIGLALCKKIVERHRGRIWARSTPGSGATFFFSIPRSAGPDAPEDR